MRIRNLKENQQGQAMAEFALITPVLLLIIFGIIQFGVLFNNYLTLTDAVRNGARQAAVSRTASDPVQATRDRVIKASKSLNLSAGDIAVEPFDPANGTNTWVQGGDVTVTATYPYSISLLGLVVKTGSLTSSTTERVE